MHHLGEGFAHRRWPRRTQHPLLHRGAGHHRRSLCHRLTQLVQLLDARVIQLAVVVPHRSLRRHHIGLAATVGDYVMGTLLQPQMLAAEVPPHVHQFHGVQRAAPEPGRPRAMGRYAVEGEHGRHQPRPTDAPRRRESTRDVRGQHDVHALEYAGVHHVGATGHQLLSHPRNDLEGSLDSVPLHDPFRRNRRNDIDRRSAVVSFSVARATGNQRIVIGHAGLLRRLGKPVDVAHDSHHGMPAPPRGDVSRRHAGGTHLYAEAFVAKNACDVLDGPSLLKTQLREAEHHVDDLLRQLGHAADLPLHLVAELVARLGCQRGCQEHGDEKCQGERMSTTEAHGRLSISI